MNWKRGFRRIAFVSALFTAIVCAGLSIALVLLIHSEAQSNLRWRKENYIQNSASKLTPDQQKRLAELRAKKTSARQEALSTEDKAVEEEKRQPFIKEKASEEARLEELQKGFLVSLSKGGLVGLCGAIGLIGGIIGFVIIWLVYKFLEWLVLGFCDNNRLHPEKT
jgi:hypothetical protein